MFVIYGLDPISRVDWARGDTWPKLCRSNPPPKSVDTGPLIWGQVGSVAAIFGSCAWKCRESRGRGGEGVAAVMTVCGQQSQESRKSLPSSSQLSCPVPSPPKAQLCLFHWVLWGLPLYPTNKLCLFRHLEWFLLLLIRQFPETLSLS